MSTGRRMKLDPYLYHEQKSTTIESEKVIKCLTAKRKHRQYPTRYKWNKELSE